MAATSMDVLVTHQEPFRPVPIAISPQLLHAQGQAALPALELPPNDTSASWRARLIALFHSWLGSVTIHLVGIVCLALILGMLPPVVRPVAQFLTFGGGEGDGGEPVRFALGGGGGSPSSAGEPSLAAMENFLNPESTLSSEHFLLPPANAEVAVADTSLLPNFGNLLSPLPMNQGGPATGNLGDGSGNGGGEGGGSGSGIGDSKGKGSGGDGTQFFSVRAGGKKFVYIVDSSHSMKGEKFATATEEVLYAINRLGSQQSFYVFFFDEITQPMKLPPEEESPKGPVQATKQNVKRASKWIKQVETGSNTHPFDAVRLALEMEPDAIFLLTDGQFSDNGKTEAYLRMKNALDKPIKGRQNKVIVHTIGLWDLSGQEALQRIAEFNSGTYRYVPPGGR